MNQTETPWWLYRASDKKKLKDLRADQIEILLQVLSSEQQGDWLVWRQGFRSWKPLASFKSILEALREAKSQIFSPSMSEDSAVGQELPATLLKETSNSALKNALVSEPKTTLESQQNDAKVEAFSKLPEDPKPEFLLSREDDDWEGVELSLDNDAVDDDRQRYRYDRTFEVLIQVEDQFLNNQTLDISLQGMKLKMPLPKKMPRYFNVEVRVKQAVIPMVCSEIKNRDGSPSNRLRIEVNDYDSLLQTILLAG
jgi:hypothetical protein